MSQPQLWGTGAGSGTPWENSSADLQDTPQHDSLYRAEDTSVSLIIATRNRCHKLVRCLQSVQSITFERRWELIIVDNGSTDETAAAVREFIHSASIPVHYVFEPKPGLGNAHNTGVEIARGKILAFTDDDCYPAADFLSRIWCAFEDPTLGYIVGRIMLHDPADHRMTINESMTPRTFPGRSYIGPGLDIQGANMAFRRQVICQIGGFDPLFGPGSLVGGAEDWDAAGRASALGWKGEYRPEVVVRHHHGRKKSDAPRMMRAWGVASGAYHMKLLLRGGEFLWFAQYICRIGRQWSGSRRMVLSEPVGMAKYAYFWLMQSFRAWQRQ
jgi:glycosyltransferase involved in cell wall biosynthesis